MKYSVIILLIVLSRISFAQTSKGDEYYQQAKDWLDKGDFTKALKAMENSRAQYLKDKDRYHYFLATDGASVICQDDGKGELAEKIVLEAIRILPKTTPENLILHARMNDNLGYTYFPSRSMIMHNHPFAFFVSEEECKDAIQITNRSREEILARNQVSIRRDVNHFQNLKPQRTQSFRSRISSFITL